VSTNTNAWNAKRTSGSDTWHLGASAPLSPEEVRDLIRNYKAKRCETSRNRVVEAHLRLVAKHARKHARPEVGFDELMGEGAMTLVRALDTFQPERGVPFTAYASVLIEHAMRRAVCRERVITLPGAVRRAAGAHRRASDKFFLREGRRPTPAELSEEMEAPRTRTLSKIMASEINSTVSSSAGDELLGLRDSTPAPDARAEKTDLLNAVIEAMEKLPASSRQLIRERFGLDANARGVTDIARRKGVSKQRVSYVVQAALNHLRRVAGEQGLDTAAA
jgi:RNA polymerase sigma factor (sigma-70 family)